EVQRVRRRATGGEGSGGVVRQAVLDVGVGLPVVVIGVGAAAVAQLVDAGRLQQRLDLVQAAPGRRVRRVLIVPGRGVEAEGRGRKQDRNGDRACRGGTCRGGGRGRGRDGREHRQRRAAARVPGAPAPGTRAEPGAPGFACA